MAPEEIVDLDRAVGRGGRRLRRRPRRAGAARRGRRRPRRSSRSWRPSRRPVFFGSALTNFGVRKLLDAVVDLVPSPSPRPDADGDPRPLDAPFSRLRVQGAGQHGPVAPRPHRLRPGLLGPLRAGHGRDPRAHRQAVRHQVRPHGVRPGARDDRGGVPRRRRRPRERHRRAHRRRALRRASPSQFPPSPPSRPRSSPSPGCKDTSKYKQFRKGVAQLDEEGVVQVLRDRDQGDPAPVLAAVGPHAVRGRRAPAGERVRRAGRARRRRRTRWPAAPTTPAPSSCGPCGACGSCERADGTRSWPCSRAPTGSTASSRSTRSWSSTAWSPRAARVTDRGVDLRPPNLRLGVPWSFGWKWGTPGGRGASHAPAPAWLPRVGCRRRTRRGEALPGHHRFLDGSGVPPGGHGGLTGERRNPKHAQHPVR